jgi:hypothetical protein
MTPIEMKYAGRRVQLVNTTAKSGVRHRHLWPYLGTMWFVEGESKNNQLLCSSVKQTSTGRFHKQYLCIPPSCCEIRGAVSRLEQDVSDCANGLGSSRTLSNFGKETVYMMNETAYNAALAEERTSTLAEVEELFSDLLAAKGLSSNAISRLMKAMHDFCVKND